MTNMVIFGAPGAGKGTQSALLVSELGYKHISTGDLFRYNMKNKTDLGQKAQSFIDQGLLVPDEITFGMVEDALEKLEGKKFILDGFPRTVDQANELDKMLTKLKLNLGLALFVEVPEEKIVSRLSGRRVCRQCGSTFHLMFKVPQKEGACDSCGGELYQRKDDNEESIQKRLQVYAEQTSPLKEFYLGKEIFVRVDGDQSEAEVFKLIKSKIS